MTEKEKPEQSGSESLAAITLHFLAKLEHVANEDVPHRGYGFQHRFSEAELDQLGEELSVFTSDQIRKERFKLQTRRTDLDDLHSAFDLFESRIRRAEEERDAEVQRDINEKKYETMIEAGVKRGIPNIKTVEFGDSLRFAVGTGTMRFSTDTGTDRNPFPFARLTVTDITDDSVWFDIVVDTDMVPGTRAWSHRSDVSIIDGEETVVIGCYPQLYHDLTRWYPVRGDSALVRFAHPMRFKLTTNYHKSKGWEIGDLYHGNMRTNNSMIRFAFAAPVEAEEESGRRM